MRARRRGREEPIRVDIPCVTLTVVVQGEDGQNVKGSFAQFYTHGGDYAVDWWPLPDVGTASQRIHLTTLTSYVVVKGPGFATQFRMGEGVLRNTTIVFVLARCSELQR